MPILILFRQILLGGVFVFVSCGGSDHDDHHEIDEPTPIVLSIGRVTNTNNITVNGNSYDINRAVITVDGITVDDSALNIGMVVEVNANLLEKINTANSVAYEKTLVGSIDSKTPNTLQVMGQTVIIDGHTVFNKSSLASLDLNQVIEVSGYRNHLNEVYATFITPDDHHNAFKALGIIDSIDADNFSFTLGDLTVNYQTAHVESVPVIGRQVSVQGLPDNYQPIPPHLIANRIVSIPTESKPHQPIELEGIVTTFDSISHFTISHVIINATHTNTFEGGSRSDIKPGILLEAEGTINADKHLIATRIIFK